MLMCRVATSFKLFEYATQSYWYVLKVTKRTQGSYSMIDW